MTEEGGRLHERDKRESLSIEDIRLGDGPLTAWSRKISADIEVRSTYGTVAYREPMFVYIGFHGDVFIHDTTKEAGALSFSQPGIWLGINGMAVGGKRRITIEPSLVSGGLLTQGTRHQAGVSIRHEKLIVEATLTASCIPVLLRIPRIIEREVGCRDANLPKRDSNTPIWHQY